MLSRLKNSLNTKNEPHWFWGIALLALFIEICFHALLPVSVSNDTYGYLHLAKNLGSSSAAFERTVGYPVFLSILGTIIYDSFVPAILAQAALAVAIPLIIFKCLVRYGLEYAILGALIACFYFYNFVVSLYFLTEPAYVFSIAIYTFLLIRYFQDLTTRNLMYVIAACWLIAMVRVSGTMHFLSLLAGISIFIIVSFLQKNPAKTKQGVKQFVIAVAVFFTISILYGSISNRTSSVVWPHFVFNWVYKDGGGNNIQYGIIKPENGPAAKKLFNEVEEIVREYPSAFKTLQAGGSKEVLSLKPEKNGNYSEKSVQILMDDITNNTKHDLRSWWIEGVLKSYKHDVVGTSEILGNAVKEAFIKHPEILLQRMETVIRERIWGFLNNGISMNIVSFPTAYYHQIPKEVDTKPTSSLRPTLYKQWTYDLFKHTGNDATNRKIDYAHTYPLEFKGAYENFKNDNLIGFGHYIGTLGTQIIRLCWIIISIGIICFTFVNNKPLLASLLSASIVPPIASVFISETDPRHLLMSSPVQIITSVLIIYLVIELYKNLKGGKKKKRVR